MATTTIDVRRDIARLEEHTSFDPEVIEFAQAAVQAAIRKMTFDSPLRSLLLSAGYRVYTGAIDTLAVTMSGNGAVMLLINPTYVTQSLVTVTRDETGVLQVEHTYNLLFALMHEADHLLNGHLSGAHNDGRDHQLGEMADEACNNYRTQRRLRTGNRIGELPRDLVTGKVHIVNPKSVFERYRKDLNEAGLAPVDSVADLCRTDDTCYAELSRMSKPSPPPKQPCEHGSGGGDGGGKDDGPSEVMLDSEAVGRHVEDVLAAAISSAVKNGDQTLREELFELIGDNPQAEQLFADLGAGALRGETTTVRKTDLWEQWTAEAMGTRLREGERLRFNRKLVAFGRRITPSGKQESKQGVIAIDASGSMDSRLLEKIASLIGAIENIEAHWLSFDAEVWPFEPGYNLRGGGGTSFQVIDDYVQTLEESPDFVLVLTDGYAPHITPREPDKWIWLITPGGDNWPARHPVPMSSRNIDLV